MTKKQRAAAIIEALERLYPDAACSLTQTDPLRLLIAVRLSAQCTDARVNAVTPELFARFPTLDALADADTEQVEELVRPCGLYRVKARDIVAICRMLRERYGGIVPAAVEELVTLPGVGRKTANLIAGDVYGLPGAVVADTHCIRIANRLGLCRSKDPVLVERTLRELLPPDKSNGFCHRLVWLGRETCTARRPKCDDCVLRGICPQDKT